ncbi:plasmid replication DNA-binding protein, partial [Acinetobacter baumannii]
KIDLAEAIRVFGEPVQKQSVKETVKVDSPTSAEVLLLRQQIDLLKNQLDDAKNRESFYQNQIETMQRLLEAPKTKTTQSDDTGSTQEESGVAAKEDVIAMAPTESEGM